jgi:hypothetical protein
VDVKDGTYQQVEILDCLPHIQGPNSQKQNDEIPPAIYPAAKREESRFFETEKSSAHTHWAALLSQAAARGCSHSQK